MPQENGGGPPVFLRFEIGAICGDWVVGDRRWGTLARPRDDRQKYLLRPALEEIIDLGHPLVRLGREITWPDMTSRFVRQIEQQTDCEKPPWQSRRRPPTASRATSSNA